MHFTGSKKSIILKQYHKRLTSEVQGKLGPAKEKVLQSLIDPIESMKVPSLSLLKSLLPRNKKKMRIKSLVICITVHSKGGSKPALTVDQSLN